MERKDGESYISYVKRTTQECSNKNISYAEWGDNILGYENVYSEDNCRKGFYIVSKLLNKIDESVNITDVELIEELEELKDSIYKEKCKLQDANREKRKYLREDARFESLVEAYKDACEFTDKIVIKEYKKIDKTKSKKYAVASWSDWHAGLKIDNQFNYYDINTMVERANTIKDKIIANCEKQDVTDLIIEINGDMLDGQIHISSRVEQEEGVLSQVVTVTDLLIKLIN